MTYDPRPVSKGGNQGIDDQFSRKASKNKFRVVGVDTFDGGDWIEGNFPNLMRAKAVVDAKTKGQQMLKMYVYDNSGKCVYSGGSF